MQHDVLRALFPEMPLELRAAPYLASKEELVQRREKVPHFFTGNVKLESSTWHSSSSERIIWLGQQSFILKKCSGRMIHCNYALSLKMPF